MILVKFGPQEELGRTEKEILTAATGDNIRAKFMRMQAGYNFNDNHFDYRLGASASGAGKNPFF